jgi:hypothetical protein
MPPLIFPVAMLPRGLGPVEIQDSQIGMSVIQAPKGVWHAPIRFDKRPVGEDGAALFG